MEYNDSASVVSVNLGGDYRSWSAELGDDLAPATFGENLTTAAIDLAAAVIGERWSVGTALLEVSQPREPCFKLGIRMGNAAFAQDFGAVGRTGTYLRIIEEGEIAAGDPITVVSRPDHELTVAGVHEAYRDGTIELLRSVAAIESVPASWRERAKRSWTRTVTDEKRCDNVRRSRSRRGLNSRVEYDGSA